MGQDVPVRRWRRPARITSVSDQESDIYEHFASRPTNVDVLVRACQNRTIETMARIRLRSCSRLSTGCRTGPVRGEHSRRAFSQGAHGATCSALLPCGAAQAAVRARDLPESVALTLVDVRETSRPRKASRSTGASDDHTITNLDEARHIIDLYRLRWTLEVYFLTLKTAGFNIEDADISEPRAMINLVAAAAVAAVTVMQLVRARDGTTGEKLTDAFDVADQPLSKLCRLGSKARPSAEEPASEGLPRLRVLGHRPPRGLDRLLWKTRPSRLRRV